MKDLINSIKVHLHERSTSPLFGAFALSWIVWNYKFIMVLLSDLNPLEKIAYIDIFLFPSIQDSFLFGVLFPLTTAVVFIYAYPIPAKIIFSYWKTKQNELNKERQKIEKQKLLSVEESQKIRQEISQLENKSFQDLEAKNRLIKQLEESRDEARKNLSQVLGTSTQEYTSQKKNKKAVFNLTIDDESSSKLDKKTLKNIEIYLLDFLRNIRSLGYIMLGDAHSYFNEKLGEQHVEALLQIFIENDYIDYKHSSNLEDMSAVRITSRGKEYLRNNSMPVKK